MKISYAIPVCNEYKEFDRLIKLLVENKRPEDEIVVQADLGNTTSQVYEVINKFKSIIKLTEFSLKGNFGAFKNNLKSHCIGEWIFQIDADEYFNPYFIQNLHLVLQQNPTIEVFLLARINTVEGLTDSHIQRWKWNVNEKGWVNFPDWQPRILQNSPKIQWANKVHEVLVGHTSYGFFPIEEEWCILHNKNINRQEAQNSLYSTI